MNQRWRKVRTTTVHDHEDVRGFFDACAPCYMETHGDAARLLRYRLSLIRQHADFQPTDTVLEIGCGLGIHLLGLADTFGNGIGIDLSPAMVHRARQRAASSSWSAKLAFHVDQGEHLHTVADASVDVVICVGVLEHLLDPAGVIAQVLRVLKSGGRFICLTLNGHHLWYRWLAPWLGIETRHLSTDQFLSRQGLCRLLSTAGLRIRSLHYWTFIPRGDMPPLYGALLSSLDRLGRVMVPDILKGGIVVCAEGHTRWQDAVHTP